MEEQLIAAVYKRKAIWDPADGLRKNSKVLNSLWKEVANEVGIDLKTARNKWKNLRAYFISQLRSLDKPKSGSGGRVKISSSWAFFNQMMFLKDVLLTSDSAREDSLTLTHTPEFFEEKYDLDNIGDANSTITETVTAFSSMVKHEDLTIPPDLIVKDNEFVFGEASINKRELSKPETENSAKKFQNEMIEIERKKVELFKRKINSDDDSDLLFFKSLVPYMKEFAPVQKLWIRSKIQDIILTEYEKNQSRSASSMDFPSTALGMISPPYTCYQQRPESSMSASSSQLSPSVTSSPVEQTISTRKNFCGNDETGHGFFE